MKDNVNHGIFRLNINDSAQKTVVVMGVARSGTSMCAIVLDKLGVNMGVKENDVVYENHEVFGRLENNQIDSFKQFVETQNTQFPLWGWKRPKAIEYVERFEPLIRNPHYIIPFRDFMAIASRNQMAVNVDLMKNLINTQRVQYKRVIDFVEMNKKPILVFSYEKAIMNKAFFVKQVADFVGVTDANKIDLAIEAIEPNAQKYLEANSAQAISQKFLGRLDRVLEGNLIGWIKDPNSKEAQNIKFYIDNQFVSNFNANHPREDLITANIGAYSFKIDLDLLDLEENKEYTFSIRDEDGNDIKHSPIKYLHKKNSAE